MNEPLNDDNFLVQAMHHYDNPQCHTLLEFEEDLKRFLYLKKLFSRYKTNGELRERLILNHLIVLYNLFGEFATVMLLHKIDRDYLSTLLTFLLFLNRVSEDLPNGMKLSDIPLDETVIKTLRNI